MEGEEPPFVEGGAVHIPIDGVLDLHNFQPREIKELISEYIQACRERGIFDIRIIHGKGVGNLRRSVHSILSNHTHVVTFSLAHPQMGGWGATVVKLRKP